MPQGKGGIQQWIFTFSDNFNNLMLYVGLHPKHVSALKLFWGFSQAQQLEIISILFTFGDISIIQHYFRVEFSNLIRRESKDQNVWRANYIHTTKIWIAGHQLASCCWCKPFRNNELFCFSNVRFVVFFYLFICISRTTPGVFASTNDSKYWHIALDLFLLLSLF